MLDYGAADGRPGLVLKRALGPAAPCALCQSRLAHSPLPLPPCRSRPFSPPPASTQGWRQAPGRPAMPAEWGRGGREGRRGGEPFEPGRVRTPASSSNPNARICVGPSSGTKGQLSLAHSRARRESERISRGQNRLRRWFVAPSRDSLPLPSTRGALSIPRLWYAERAES